MKHASKRRYRESEIEDPFKPDLVMMKMDLA